VGDFPNKKELSWGSSFLRRPLSKNYPNEQTILLILITHTSYLNKAAKISG
jgi:hypothetical protein